MKPTLSEITEHMGRLKAGRIATRFFTIVFGLCLSIAIVILLGVVSTGDFQAETKYVPTAQELRAQNITFIVGFIVAVICGLLLIFCKKINAFIDRELARCRRMYKRRLDRTVQAARETAVLDLDRESTGTDN